MITSIQPIILTYIKERCISYQFRCRLASTQLGRSSPGKDPEKYITNNYDIAAANAPTLDNPIMHMQGGK